MMRRSYFSLCLIAVAVGFLGCLLPAFSEDVVETPTMTFRGRVTKADFDSVTIEIFAQGRMQELTVPRQTIKKLVVEPPPSVLLGIEAYEKDDWKKAKLNLERIILNYQGLDVEWAQKGVLYYGQSCLSAGDYANAEKAFDLFLKTYPKHELLVDAKLGQADVARAKKQYEEALDIFNELAEPYLQLLRPFQEVMRYPAEIFLGIGKCLEEQGNYEGALESFLKVIALYPEEIFYPEALYHCALAFSEMNELDKALRRLDELINDYPASPSARSALELRNSIEKKKKEVKEPTA